MGKHKTYVADFETTTTQNESHVWAYAICDIKTPENVIIGNTLDEFMGWCRNQKDNPTILFHNIKFDGSFIIDYLFKHNFEHVTEPKERATGTFTTLISDKGLWYTIEVIFYKKGNNIRKVTFQDSLKLIPLSVDAIAKSFDLPIQKLKIDYASHNELPEGSPLTAEEEEYIKHDVQIVAHAVNYFYDQGLNKMTIGSCALNEFKQLINPKYFKLYFPPPKYYDDVRRSYKGGFTYLNPNFANKLIEDVIVLDVNSLYPSVMYNNYLPFGTPIFYKGKYEEDELYPLYIQALTCTFELKKNKIPTIQLKETFGFSGTEYLTSSNDEDVLLVLTSVDLELFLEHYDVENIQFISGWKFKATKGIFKDYIDKWSEAKIQAKKEGNHGLYLLAKLFLNNLYGKFGSSNVVKSKIPYFDEDSQTVKFYDSEPEEKEGVYLPMASFITSWARNKTIRSAQAIQDKYYNNESKAQFVYADTDSLHIYLNGETQEEFFNNCNLEIDSTKLGAWDFEASAGTCKFLRAKCYMENHRITEEDYFKGLQKEDSFLYSKDEKGYYKLKITVAGMPKNCYSQVTFSNFKIGASYGGKLQPKRVKGGTVLKEVDFTIKK